MYLIFFVEREVNSNSLTSINKQIDVIKNIEIFKDNKIQISGINTACVSVR